MRKHKLMYSAETEGQEAVVELNEPVPDVISGVLADTYIEDYATLTNQIDNAIADTATLVTIADKLEECSEVSMPTLVFTSIAVEAMNDRLGIEKRFDFANMTPADGRKLVLESIGESIARAWKAIVAALKRMWQMTKDFFKNAFGIDAHLDKTIKDCEIAVAEFDPPNPDEVAPEEPETAEAGVTETPTEDKTDYSKPVNNRIIKAPSIAGKGPQLISSVYYDLLQVGPSNEVGAKVLVPAISELNGYVHKELTTSFDQVAEVIKEICGKLIDNNFKTEGLTHGPLPHPGVEVRNDKTFVAVAGAESFISSAFPGNKGFLYTVTDPDLFKKSEISLGDTTKYYFHIRTHSRPSNANPDKRADVLTKNEMVDLNAAAKALKNHREDFLKHTSKVTEELSKLIDGVTTKAADAQASPECTSGVLHLNTLLSDLSRKVDNYLVNLITLSIAYVQVSKQMNNRRNRKKQ